MSKLRDEVFAEIERAMRMFPKWPTDPIHAASVVQEEAGELVKAVNEAVYEPHKGSRPNVRTEAIQTAAMCFRFLASIDKYEYFHSGQHEQAALAESEAPAPTKTCVSCGDHKSNGGLCHGTTLGSSAVNCSNWYPVKSEAAERECGSKPFLHVSANVRYWEDATINGLEDSDGKLIPFRVGDLWKPVIDVDAGTVVSWPQGVTAKVYYKVCDSGTYWLTGAKGEVPL